MGWPKGLKRTPKTQEDRGSGSHESESPVAVISKPQPRENIEPSAPWPGPMNFEVGRWYLFTPDEIIMEHPTGRVCKWSVIKFEVIKVTKEAIAVRFEDGSFEAIIDPGFTQFKEIKAPNY